MEREKEIRVIAHSIWEQEGRRDGHDCEYWFKAEVVWEQSQKTKAAFEKTTPKNMGTTETRKKNKTISRKS